MGKYTNEQQAIIDRIRDEYLDGRAFRRYARSAGSVIGYQPPASERQYVQLYKALAAFAGRSREAAHFALAIRLPGIGYTNGQLNERIWKQAAEAVEAGWDDVIGRAGPEVGPYSQYQHRYSLRTLLDFDEAMRGKNGAMQTYSAPGCGWVHSALVEELLVEYINAPVTVNGEVK